MDKIAATIAAREFPRRQVVWQIIDGELMTKKLFLIAWAPTVR